MSSLRYTLRHAPSTQTDRVIISVMLSDSEKIVSKRAINTSFVSMKNHQYHVYILKCADDSYYVGVTNDIQGRIHEHNHSKDKSSYTYTRRPVKLVFQTQLNDIEMAIAYEKKLKGWTRKKKEALINGEFNDLPILSKKHFDKK